MSTISRPMARGRGEGRSLSPRPLCSSLFVLALLLVPGLSRAQTHDPSHSHTGEGMTHDPQAPGMDHEMFMWMPENGWAVLGMAQVFPTAFIGQGSPSGGPLDQEGLYLTQPVLMGNLESPGSFFTTRLTLNFEGLWQEGGERTYGGWGEGYLDNRHPHTFLHEAMLSLNFLDEGGPGGTGPEFSLSLGKGFAAFGTDDPMARPVLKYPTNHHLSQILERWTVNGVALWRGWGVEASIFGGAEPTGPWDLSNIDSFGDSWSVRLSRRIGPWRGISAPWEITTSFARITENHGGEDEEKALFNVALRHDRDYGFGRLYGLVEYSQSFHDEHGGGHGGDGHGDGPHAGDPAHAEVDPDHFALLAEVALDAGPHRPYVRMEYSTRPEYPRNGVPGQDGFFRYDLDAEVIGSSRWLITTVGYGFSLTRLPYSVRPFVEFQHFAFSEESGGVDPEALFSASSAWGLSVGARVFLGGGQMRMGSYGALDSMTRMHR